MKISAPAYPPGYLDEIDAYMAWWRGTSARDRRHVVHKPLAWARARSLWYEEHGLDAHALVPKDAPYISRQMLQAHPGAFIGDVDALRRGGYTGRTSGSTGEPVSVMMCPWALAHYTAHLEYALMLAGHRLPRAPRVLYLSLSTGAKPTVEPSPALGGIVARVDAAHVEDAVAFIKTFRPHMLSLSPLDLDRLLDAKLPLSAFIDVVFSTGGRLSDRTFYNFYSQFNDKKSTLMNSYGCAEVGPLAIQCPAHGGPGGRWHVPPGSAVLETITCDDLLAITTLRNRAMPLTRYLVGDSAQGLIEDHRCAACGHIGQSFETLRGRTLQHVLNVRGRLCSAVGWIRVLNDPRHRVVAHRITQPERGVLRIEYELLGAAQRAQPGALKRALRAVDEAMSLELIESVRGEA